MKKWKLIVRYEYNPSEVKAGRKYKGIPGLDTSPLVGILEDKIEGGRFVRTFDGQLHLLWPQAGKFTPLKVCLASDLKNMPITKWLI